MSKRKTQLLQAVFHRDGGKCAYCGRETTIEVRAPFGLRIPAGTMDHVIPKSKGGTSAMGNLVLACFDCNGKKADQPLNEFINGQQIAPSKRS